MARPPTAVSPRGPGRERPLTGSRVGSWVGGGGQERPLTWPQTQPLQAQGPRSLALGLSSVGHLPGRGRPPAARLPWGLDAAAPLRAQGPPTQRLRNEAVEWSVGDAGSSGWGGWHLGLSSDHRAAAS